MGLSAAYPGDYLCQTCCVEDGQKRLPIDVGNLELVSLHLAAHALFYLVHPEIDEQVAVGDISVNASMQRLGVAVRRAHLNKSSSRLACSRLDTGLPILTPYSRLWSDVDVSEAASLHHRRQDAQDQQAKRDVILRNLTLLWERCDE